jgi:hypothetical protein
MKKGTVLLHHNFKFEDGEVKSKYLILLNDFTQGQNLLMVLTTSNQRRYPYEQGCHSDRNTFVITETEEKDIFKKRTWVQIDRINEFDVKELMQKSFEKNVEIKGVLKEHIIRGIINCTMRIKDISEYHISVLKAVK